MAIHDVPSSTQLRTFLIADVRGYTRFTVERGDEAAARLASSFAQICEQVAEQHDGAVVELRGDEALCVFPSARNALRSALDLQGSFQEAIAHDPSLPLEVGMGLDAGEAIPVKGGYRGGALNLAARLCSLARAGEVLASDAVTHLAGKMEGVSYTERGQVELKGFADPVMVMQVVEEHGPKAEEAEAVTDEEKGQIPKQDLPIGGFLGALPANPLVGREEELGEILLSVDVVVGGAGRLVMLAGEPGAGKTRLAQEVTLNLRNRGFLLAAGSCFEPRQSVPYYPFLDALTALYGLATPAIRFQVAQRWPYIGRLLPEAGIPSPPPSGGQDDQERLFRSVTAFIQAVARQIPVAILLDDLHWSDGASLDLLQHLARHTRGDRVLICATYRDVEVGRQHPLERTLHDLHRQGLMARILVRRLDQARTGALVASTFGEEVSEEFASLIYRHTEGNPFFTQEVLRSLVERGDIFREDDRWERREVGEIEVPESVRAVIGQRLSRLQESTQDLLREASVLGPSFRFDDLQALRDRPEEAVELALEEALEAGILRETGRDVYTFNHALTQQALYAELSGRRRRRLHLAAGEALERLPERDRTGRVAELAWHFVEADDTERAFQYSMLAGAGAEDVFARDEAVLHYRRAVELAQDLTAIDPSRRNAEAEALFKLGRMLVFTDRHPEAQRVLEEAAQRYAVLGNPLMEGSAIGTAELSYRQAGMGEQAQDAAKRSARLLPAIEASGPSADLVRFWRTQGIACAWTARYEDVLSCSVRAVEVARAVGDPALLRQAEVDHATALGLSGHLQEAIATAEAVIPRAEASNDLDTLLGALFTGAEFSMLGGDFEASQRYRERELRVSERTGDQGHVAFTLANLAQLAVYSGAWQEARDYAERSVAIARSIGNEWWATMARSNLGVAVLLQGDVEQGVGMLEECILDFERLGNIQGVRYLQRELAEIDLRAGRACEALARLELLMEGTAVEDNDVTFVLPVLAWAYLATGDSTRAEKVLVDAIDRARQQGNALSLVTGLRVRGLVLAARGEWDEADRHFSDAVSLARQMPHPYAEALALLDRASGWERRGRTDQARTHLEQALTIFRRLDAKPDIERTEQALAEIALE